VEDRQQRLYGCALGAAVGDALGMPLEFGPAIPESNFIRDMKEGRLPAGSFTDDTEMALALAESLACHLPLDPIDLSQRFVDWMKTNPPDIGLHTSEVLNLISDGKTWYEVEYHFLSTKPNSAGNGSIIRCWPVAVSWWDNMNNLIHDSQLQSRVTHAHPDCIAGSVFINLLISEFVKGKSRESALGFALENTPELSKAFISVISTAPGRSRAELKNTGWVRHTIESAVWGLMNFESFSETIIQVINLGNDADTAGAVAGAIAGAFYGLDAIPMDWINQLHGEWPVGSENIWFAQDLCDLVDLIASL
jgi:ADP-ribosyl-[dinitrogen reductase] hydrolase